VWNGSSFVPMDGPGYLALGTSAAGGGTVRMSSGFTAQFRNAANSADLYALATDGSNILYVGTDTGFTSAKQAAAINIYATSGGSVAIGTAGNTTVSFASTTTTLWSAASVLQFGSSGAAAAGTQRMQNACSITSRNQGGTADITMLATDASNQVSVGDGTNTAHVLVSSANGMMKLLTTGLCAVYAHFGPSNGANSLTAAQSAATCLVLDAGASGAVTVTSLTAAAAKQLVCVRNNTSQTVTFQFASGTGVTLNTATSAWITSDGTNAVKMMAGT
jgi:hypothetical protein